MSRGVHGEKIVSAIENDKLPASDVPMLKEALEKYDKWISSLNDIDGNDLDDIINKMVNLLNNYKYYIDVNLIFDSKEDFLYRQKGQLKIDNTVMEEFLPILVTKCLSKCTSYDISDLDIGSQTPIFSSMYFQSCLSTPEKGGGMSIKAKDQDFSMSRKLYIRSSYSKDFNLADTVTSTTHLGYVLAEIKTNLDKTMFQEGSATAHDVKLAVTGAKYYLLCDFLDMTPISTSTTDIDEILITRKAKRLGSNIRSKFNSYVGRQSNRDLYIKYLSENPYSAEVLKRFINHVISQLKNEDLIEESVLDLGYF